MEIKPLRGYRYSGDTRRDISPVVAPPYDQISPESQERLYAMSPHNIVRVTYPREAPDQYEGARQVLDRWLAEGVWRADAKPAIYPYDQTYLAGERSVTRTGFIALGEVSDYSRGVVLPHERTHAGPKKDRMDLLEATAADIGLLFMLTADPDGALRSATAPVDEPIAEARDLRGERHRLWRITDPAAIRRAQSLMADRSVIIADGHHRYETALRFCDERRRGPVVEEEPAWAEILMLILEPVEGPLTVLPTHRVLLGLDAAAIDRLGAGLGELFEVEAGVGRERLLAEFGAGSEARGGEGRFGLWTRQGSAILRASRPAFAPFLPAGGDAVRRLDVTLASVAIERIAGIDPTAVAEGHIAFTMDAAEAIAWVDAGAAPTGGPLASAALLLDPTPASEIVAVAADGDVMPQKSTYIYPKALTGLVINPLE